MKYLTVISTICLGLLFVGCTTKPEIITKTEYIQKEPLKLTADRLFLSDVKFNVIIQNNKPYYALDPHNYKNLSINMKEIQNYINEQNLILKKYKEYYETPLKKDINEPSTVK